MTSSGLFQNSNAGSAAFEPGDIVRLNFQMRRQIVKEPHLVPHIQVLNCLADFLNRVHARKFTRNFSNENSVPRAGESVLAIANFRSDVSFFRWQQKWQEKFVSARRRNQHA